MNRIIYRNTVAMRSDRDTIPNSYMKRRNKRAHTSTRSTPIAVSSRRGTLGDPETFICEDSMGPCPVPTADATWVDAPSVAGDSDLVEAGDVPSDDDSEARFSD
jgi:hypothetical protein